LPSRPELSNARMASSTYLRELTFAASSNTGSWMRFVGDCNCSLTIQSNYSNLSREGF
jgi:hypothetical protein